MQFPGGGEMGARMRAFDGGSSPVGPPDQWPRSLTAAVKLLLASRYPMFLWWGEELTYFYNDGYAPILGKKHPAALGRPAREVWAEIWPDLAPLVEAVLVRGEATWNENFPLFMERNGFPEEVFFTFSYSPAFDDDGRVGGLFCACTEETRRVLAERRLRPLRELAAVGASAQTVAHACQRVASVLAGSPRDLPFASLYLVDPDGASARRVAGAAPAALPEVVSLAAPGGAWPFSAVVTSRRPVWVEDALARHGPLPGTPWPEPCHTVALLPILQTGQERALGVLVAGVSPRRPFDDDYRDFLGLVASSIGSSISGARAHEEAEVRARELAELDRAKTAFFSNVSHEFRTPLTLMLGPVTDALAGPRRALEGDDLEGVHRNVLRLLKLVNALLDFSRLEAGRAAPRCEPTDLAALTTSLADGFRKAFERAGLGFAVEVEPLPELAFVDRAMWEKVVLNLLSNAFKFTFEGEVTLRLRADAASFVLEVHDTGIGVADADLPRLFLRFQRVEGARARTQEGSGIGLALVQELIGLHGGAVAVESRVGVGTTFTITLPRGAGHVVEVADSPATAEALGAAPFVEEAVRWLPEGAEAPAPPAPSSRRVLVADDSADMRDYLRKLLSPWWTVEACADGAAALEAARRARPDLVLTDVMMPGLDGFELLAALRADEETRHVPVIMLSARAGDEALVEGIDAGADDYVVKPFSGRELVARIRTHLELARLRDLAAGERDRLRRILEQAPLAVVLCEGPALRVTTLNRLAAERLGVGPVEGVLGRPLEEALPALAGGALPRALREALEAGAPRAVPERAVPVGGAERVLSFTVHPLRDERGDVGAVMLGVQDLTDQVLARREVERLVAELRLADRKKDEFLAMLAHELRNPLAPVQTAVELLRRRVPDAAAARPLDVIARQVAGLSRLIDDLLDVSRITRGKIELRRERVDVAAAIGRALEATRDLVAARRHEVTVATPSPPAFVLADPTRLEQVLVNLLTNAAKYTDAGGRIVVSAARAPAGRVAIRVRDTGRGIPPALLERVFDLFEQGPGTLDRSAGGLGVGLTIVKRLVELHGGAVAARSEGAGRGTEVEVQLPQDEARAAVRVAAPTRRVDAPSLRALVVDDNVDAAETLADLLRELGHEVRTAHDGQAALAGVEAWRPHVVFLDLGLPRVDGFEVARRVAGPSAPYLVAVSGYGQEEDRRRSAAAGFGGHLVKPPALDEILDALDTAARRVADRAAV